MLSIKEFNKKIVSLKNTKKLTKTMKMVSASKFKRAHKAQVNAESYAHKLKELMARLSGNAGEKHPLMKNRKLVSKVLVLLFTSDKGLCGGFNNNLIRKTRNWVTEFRYKFNTIDMSFCGKKGNISLRRTVKVIKNYENFTAKPDFNNATVMAQDLTNSFINGEYDEIYLAYNRFDGPLTQTPQIEKILPLDPKELTQADIALKQADYAYEPKQDELFNFLIPKYLNFKLFFILLENSAGEHGSRMAAMDKASQNTSDLIDQYTLLRNRARQAAITTELIEIISGAEALK